jgi:tRNA(Ile)-lysidine synthase TilS/MesJ
MFFLINKQKKLKINNIHNKKKEKQTDNSACFSCLTYRYILFYLQNKLMGVVNE